MKKEIHNIAPIFDSNSRILILGSFPSKKSREAQFYYAHKRNRFWKTISRICSYNIPETENEKRNLLLENRIALWDVVESCSIKGSNDASLSDVVINDVGLIIERSDIEAIFCNGRKSAELYKKHLYDSIQIEAIVLPSTSPANASFSDDDLYQAWNDKLNTYLQSLVWDNC